MNLMVSNVISQASHKRPGRPVTGKSIRPVLELLTSYTYRQAERHHHLKAGVERKIHMINRTLTAYHIRTPPTPRTGLPEFLQVSQLVETFFNQSPAACTVKISRPARLH